MRAAVLKGPRQWVLEEVPVPEPKADEVLIRMEGCGVCGSNLPIWEGRDWFQYPVKAGNPGHEGWGYVAAVGEDVTEWQVGDRVTALTYHAFAPYDLAHRSQVIALPESLDGRPMPGEPLGCAINVFRRARIFATDTVVVIGSGFLGTLLVSLCARAGARVAAVSRRESALEFAKEYGAEFTVRDTGDGQDVTKQLHEWAGSQGVSVVIEATGAAGPIDLATNLLKERGRMVIAGFHQDGLRQVNLQQWNWLGLDVINAHERDPLIYLDGMKRAVELQALEGLDPRRLYTHTFALEDIQQAFETMHERPEGFMKALVLMNS
ncbi:MAG: zinc-binding dehydrogenase [Verrucomicrobiota bacterium JB022]|nr:zinc-binding dehydrogenase [Verrucomicrobiota bacterium JB022]